MTDMDDNSADEDVVRAIASAVSGSADRRVRAARVARIVRSRGGYRWVGVYSIHGASVVNEAWDGPGPPEYPEFPADQGLTGTAVATATTVVSNDVSRDPRYLAALPDTAAELIVPIVRDGRVIGTLDVESDRVGTFTAVQQHRLERIAGALMPLWDSGEAP